MTNSAIDPDLPAILATYALMAKVNDLGHWLGTLPAPLNKMKIMGDSGAFSALHSGIEVDVDGYCEWLDRCDLNCYPCLDVIGDPVQTRLNWQEMRKRGYDPMPVIHGGATTDHLKWYIDQGATYIALGGLVGAPDERARWINDMMGVAFDAGVGLHGFGVTTRRDMTSFPWRSVDSSSWMSAGRFGACHVFDGVKLRSHMIDTGLRKGRGLTECQDAGYPVARILNGQVHWTELQRVAWANWCKYATHIRRIQSRSGAPWTFTLYFAGMSQSYLHHIFGDVSYSKDGEIVEYHKQNQ